MSIDLTKPLLILLLRKQKQLIFFIWERRCGSSHSNQQEHRFSGVPIKNLNIKNRFRDEIYSELTLNNVGFGCYVCVIDANKNSQTTCINVVDCKIVTEVCQLFFSVRCVSVVFRHRYLRRCGFGLPRCVVQVVSVKLIASKTRSYPCQHQYKRFPYPSFRAISCKRVLDLACLSNTLNLLWYYIIPHQWYDVKIFFKKKFAFGTKFLRKPAKHI